MGKHEKKGKKDKTPKKGDGGKHADDVPTGAQLCKALGEHQWTTGGNVTLKAGIRVRSATCLRCSDTKDFPA